LAFCSIFMWIWFSKYAVGAPICCASSTTGGSEGCAERLLADDAGELRAVAHGGRDLFHHRDPAEVRREDRDDIHLRHISRTLAYTALAETRCRADAASASGDVRDVMPATSMPRTLSSARKWNPLTNPPPMIP